MCEAIVESLFEVYLTPYIYQALKCISMILHMHFYYVEFRSVKIIFLAIVKFTQMLNFQVLSLFESTLLRYLVNILGMYYLYDVYDEKLR